MREKQQSPAGSAGQRQGDLFGSIQGINKYTNNQVDTQIVTPKFSLKIPENYVASEVEIVSTAGGGIPVTPDLPPCANSDRVLGISAEKLLNMDIIEIPFLIDGLIHKVGLAAIAGSSDTGKSAFLRYLCMSICAKKSEFLNFKINATHNRAIYVSTEDDELSTANLLCKQNKDLDVDPSELSGLRFVFDTENLLDTLDTMLSESSVDIVVIDAFTDLYTKSMNDISQVRGYLNEYSQLAQKHQCLFLFLHHCGKRTENFVPSKDNLIGSQGFEGKMRLVLELRSDFVDVSYKHLCCVKGNYLPAKEKSESYKLKFTENLTFEDTGERVLFTDLKKSDDSDADIAKYELAVRLQSEGMSMDDIAEKLGYRNKSSVSRLLKKYGNN